MKYILYQTTNLINNKIYIGQHKTKDPLIFDGYIGCGIKINTPSSYMKPCSPLQYAVKKYGVKNFRRTTLKVVDTLEEVLKLEAEIVDYNFIKRPDTYNAQLGGTTGYKYLPINQFDLNGKFIKTWNTMIEAAEFYNVSHTAIYNAVHYKGSCVKYYWAKEQSIDTSKFLNTPETKVFQYNAITGKFIQMYNSVKEAALAIGVTQQSIGNAMKSGYKIKEYYFNSSLIEEWRGKPKVSLKGKNLYVYNLDGEYLTTLKNGNEIREYFHIKTTNQITTAIRKEIPYKNYQVSLEYRESLPKAKIGTFYKRAVLVYTVDGKFVEELPTITKTIEKYSYGAQKVLKGTQKQCRGYIFKYKEE